MNLIIPNFLKIYRHFGFEEVTEPNFISIDNELKDDELLESNEQYEEEMKSPFDSYDDLLENEVSAFLLH